MKLVRGYAHVRQKNRFVKQGGMSYIYNYAPHDPVVMQEVEAASDYEKKRFEKQRRRIKRAFYC